MTLPENETGIVTVTHKRYSVFRIFLLTSYLVGLRRSFASSYEKPCVWTSWRNRV